MKKAHILFLLTIAFCLGAMAQSPKAKSIKNGKYFKWRNSLLTLKPVWYKSDKAIKIADNILLYQSEAGAWPKNIDITIEPQSEDYLQEALYGKIANTIDNGATTKPLTYLALVITETGIEKYKKSFYRGLDYLLKAQYSNGGWPQFYPLREKGYYSEITYNDNAMMNVMNLLNDLALNQRPFWFVTSEYKNKAKEAVDKGVDCILKTQIKVNGKLTAWCAQHNQHTLQPAWARNFEPPSISGSESVNIVKFLMGIDNPPNEVIKSVKSAIAWFKEVQIHGIICKKGMGDDGKPDRWVIHQDNASPIWARFYDIETNKPIFVGRDKVIHYKHSEVERERRLGYAYYGYWPKELINEEYPRWLKKNNIKQ